MSPRQLHILSSQRSSKCTIPQHYRSVFTTSLLLTLYYIFTTYSLLHLYYLLFTTSLLLYHNTTDLSFPKFWRAKGEYKAFLAAYVCRERHRDVCI